MRTHACRDTQMCDFYDGRRNVSLQNVSHTPECTMSGTHLARASRSAHYVPHRDPRVVVAVGVGGVVGTLCRALVSQWMPPGTGFPWTTLIINLIGAGLLAWVFVATLHRTPPTSLMRPLLGTGFCGALTTFSTLQVEALRLILHGHLLIAVSYLLTSLISGLLVCALVLRGTRRHGAPI